MTKENTDARVHASRDDSDSSPAARSEIRNRAGLRARLRLLNHLPLVVGRGVDDEPRAIFSLARRLAAEHAQKARQSERVPLDQEAAHASAMITTVRNVTATVARTKITTLSFASAMSV